MILHSRYRLFSVLLVVFFVYLTVTEGLGRWSETVEQFSELREKQNSILEPEQIVTKKATLLQRKATLTNLFTRGSRRYDQSQTGVFEFLTTAAQGSGVTLQSLIPAQSVRKGNVGEVGFKIQLNGRYHNIGRFINEIENGPFGISLKVIDVLRNESKSSPLKSYVEGMASLVSMSKTKDNADVSGLVNK